MNRYLVFAGDRYYPFGGWEDFKGSFETLEHAIAHADREKGSFGWAHVIDLTLRYDPDKAFDWGMSVYEVSDS